jgi:hypothetical protein
MVNLDRYVTDLEVNRVAFFKPSLHLSDRRVGMSIKDIEMTDTIFGEEGASDTSVKPSHSSHRWLILDPQTLCIPTTHFHNSPE